MTSFIETITCDEGELRPLRHRLARWLAVQGESEETSFSVKLWVHEAVREAIGNGRPGHTVEVRAANEELGVQVELVDSGLDEWWNDTTLGEDRRSLTLLGSLGGGVDAATGAGGRTLSVLLPHDVPAGAV
jgi:hypothetical protein